MFHTFVIFNEKPNHDELLRDVETETVFPGLLPAENFYGSMATWEETLSEQHRRTSALPEIGFHAVFGEVDPKWYMEWYMQLRRKLQV